VHERGHFRGHIDLNATQRFSSSNFVNFVSPGTVLDRTHVPDTQLAPNGGPPALPGRRA